MCFHSASPGVTGCFRRCAIKQEMYFHNLGFEVVKLVVAFLIEVVPGSKRHSMQIYFGVAFPACYPQTLYLNPPRNFHYKMLGVRARIKLFFIEFLSLQNDMKCRLNIL